MNNRKHLFRLIKTYPTKDKMATCVYGSTREKLQIESSPGNRNSGFNCYRNTSFYMSSDVCFCESLT